MLIVGLIFLAVIALGELTHWAGNRRRVSVEKLRDELPLDALELARVALELVAGGAPRREQIADELEAARLQHQVAHLALHGGGHAASLRAGSSGAAAGAVSGRCGRSAGVATAAASASTVRTPNATRSPWTVAAAVVE